MQRRDIHILVTFIAITAMFLLFYGCGPRVQERAAKDRHEEQRAEVQPAQEPSPEPQPEQAKPAPAPETTDIAPLVFEDIGFDFDRFDLKSHSRDVLNRIAFTMFDQPELSLVIEGHCDERGSNEYNLALGERRSHAAKDYLIEMGVEPHRISTLSYGEEMPLVLAHNEAAWAKNRRAHFVIMR